MESVKFKVDSLDSNGIEYVIEKSNENGYKIKTSYVYSNGDVQEFLVQEAESDPDSSDETPMALITDRLLLQSSLFQ